MSIKDEIFTWREKHPHATKEQFYAAFKDHNRNTIRTYWNLFTPNISPDIYLTNLDTIREMEIAIQQIDDPVKRAENLARLHNMKLKPIANKEEKTLKEIFDAVD
jgi:hypothetical protein